MIMYIVVCDDGNGENQDFFVLAKTPAQALELYLLRREESENLSVDDVSELRLFEVPVGGMDAGVHEWPDPVYWGTIRDICKLFGRTT